MTAHKITDLFKKSYQKIKERLRRFFNWIVNGIKNLFSKKTSENGSASQNNLEIGVNFDDDDKLLKAINQDDLSAVKKELKNPDLDMTTLIISLRAAIKNNKPEIAKILLSFYKTHKKRLPHFYEEGASKKYDEYSIFLSAIKANDAEIFKLCLDSFDTDINLSKYYTCTGPHPLKALLYFAMEYQNYEIVDLLVDKGAHFGTATYTKEELNHLALFEKVTKALLYHPQTGISKHLPDAVVGIVESYLIPAYAPTNKPG